MKKRLLMKNHARLAVVHHSRDPSFWCCWGGQSTPKEEKNEEVISLKGKTTHYCWNSGPTRFSSKIPRQIEKTLTHHTHKRLRCGIRRRVGEKSTGVLREGGRRERKRECTVTFQTASGQGYIYFLFRIDQPRCVSLSSYWERPRSCKARTRALLLLMLFEAIHWSAIRESPLAWSSRQQRSGGEREETTEMTVDEKKRNRQKTLTGKTSKK